MNKQRSSIRATYDSRETGPQYTVTTRVGSRTISFEQPINDPFVRTTVRVSMRDALRELLHHRRIEVEVVVGGARDRVNDVLELDENQIVPNSTRRAAFHAHVNERLGNLAS